MTERSPLDPPDAEELAAAAALEAALDGRPASAELPDNALETAALLRFSTDQGRLHAGRRGELRDQLFSSLPERPIPPARVPFWRSLWMPLGLLGAAAAVVIGIQVSSQSSKDAALTSAAAPALSADETEADEVVTGEATASRPAPAAEAPMEAKGRASAAAPLGALAQAAPSGLAENARNARTRLLPNLQKPTLERAHQLADSARSEPELEAARGALTAIAGNWSAQNLDEAETRWARQDVLCRLAEVALRLGQPRSALEWTRQGLELDGPPSPFLAQLFALDGQAHAQLGDQTAAAASYMKALRVNERLLDEHLGGAGAESPRKESEP
jgi:tetratricopeptide (TPR) repeat protein